MLSVTKIFRFEAAHVIHGYPGKCARIHGHSYVLHVTIGLKEVSEGYLPGTGMVMDFSDLKRLVNHKVVDRLDHRLIVSQAWCQAWQPAFAPDELVVMEAEPTAENILQWLVREIQQVLPEQIHLVHLRLYETQDSYAEWQAP